METKKGRRTLVGFAFCFLFLTGCGTTPSAPNVMASPDLHKKLNRYFAHVLVAADTFERADYELLDSRMKKQINESHLEALQFLADGNGDQEVGFELSKLNETASRICDLSVLIRLAKNHGGIKDAQLNEEFGFIACSMVRRSIEKIRKKTQ